MTETSRRLFSVSDASVRAGGFFVSMDNSDPDILSVVIDSRDVKPGDLFIALDGENTDGHNYITQASGAGASAVMVSDSFYADNSEIFSGSEFNCSLIVVKNTLLGFQKLAGSWVSEFGNLIKIAVTGSNGKSTTKEMIGAILAEEGNTIINEGNLNSETGLPLSVLKIEKKHKFGVFEMGINHPGEMKALVSVFKPDYSLVTNIGTAHIGLMGSKEAIASEKSDIFSSFDKKNTGFISEYDEWSDYMENHCAGQVIRYGTNSTFGVEDVTSVGLGGWKIRYMGTDINLKLVGKHNLNNAIASISLASTLGVGPDKIKKGLEKIQPLRGRSQIIEGKYTVIEDSYNANVDSVSEIFSFISDLDWTGRLILVLGSMKELGSSSSRMHELVGTMAAGLDPDLIFFFGEEMKTALESARKGMSPGQLIYTSDYLELEEKVLDFIKEGDLLLIKGSRSMELNKLADKIVDCREASDV